MISSSDVGGELSPGAVGKLHYEMGATYSFDFQMAIQSDGFGGVGALRQDERISAKCDLTTWPYSSSEYLLELDVYEMRHESIQRDGSALSLPAVGDDRLAQHPFFAVQEHGGAITRVLYPEAEELEIVNLKKGERAVVSHPASLFGLGLACLFVPAVVQQWLLTPAWLSTGYMSMFHTRASLFADGGPAEAAVEEEDEHGNHTVKYTHVMHAVRTAALPDTLAAKISKRGKKILTYRIGAARIHRTSKSYIDIVHASLQGSCNRALTIQMKRS